jgi:hypothetical protein
MHPINAMSASLSPYLHTGLHPILVNDVSGIANIVESHKQRLGT